MEFAAVENVDPGQKRSLQSYEWASNIERFHLSYNRSKNFSEPNKDNLQVEILPAYSYSKQTHTNNECASN